ncbi:uncharacterized protein [Amphiura filiformis]|uniref:uncharacterized protein n=1 Tax=Amphiura filiformis TaxID=82378 RepID=UPI003B2110CC
MGCGNSADNKPDEDGAHHRRPKVSIRIGNHVERDKEQTQIVFVFGKARGPGSKKGRICDDIVNMYNFVPVSAEDVILKELPKKVQNVLAIENTKGLADMLKENPDALTLEWVIQKVAAEIEKDPKQNYLVDIVPNLRCLLRCQKFIKDPSYEMKEFGKKFPNTFALNLAIPEEKVIKQITAHGPKHADKMKEAGQSDEADTSRTQRRNALYQTSVKEFLNFFNEQGRLVTVDVSCGVSDLIWHRVSDFLGSELSFLPKKTINTVILFGFDHDEFSDLDMERYATEKVNLKNLVTDNASCEEMLTALRKHIDSSAPTSESFAVDATDIDFTKFNLDKTKMTRFEEEGETFLDRYIFVTKEKDKKRGRKSSLYSKVFKVIATTENEVCLFPPTTDLKVCHHIALHLAQHPE